MVVQQKGEAAVAISPNISARYGRNADEATL